MMSSRKLTGPQKSAAILIALGVENASSIYRYLKEEDVEQITYEIAQLPHIEADELDNILDDFYQICLTQKVITDGGVEYARNVLEKTYGAQAATSLLEKVTKSIRTKAFDFIRKTDYKNLMAAIQNEHPQTIALVLSYSRADLAAAVIAELPKEKRIEVVERIAKMDKASPDVIGLVEKNLEMKFSSFMSVDFTEVGGINYTADIMNNMDRANERFIFDEIIKRDAKLADDIRKKMFVFEDIVFLDPISIQRFLRDVETRDLVYALKGANAEVSNIIFANMSNRMSETIRSDLEYTHNVRLKDVEEAQQRIVGVIRNLEESGELVIAKGGKDDIIA